MKQAARIQTRRRNLALPGLAQAVRRFLKRAGIKRSGLPNCALKSLRQP